MKKAIKFSLILLALFAFCGAITVCALFPNKYSTVIERAASEFSLPPPLVRAVTKTESGFDASAVSKAGAQGLMQIMPDTFAEIQENLDVTDPFDPKDNVRAGCFYLRRLIDEFNNVDLALMAYNAGAAHVKSNLNHLDDVYPETRAYVKKVNSAYKVYNVLNFY